MANLREVLTGLLRSFNSSSSELGKRSPSYFSSSTLLGWVRKSKKDNQTQQQLHSLLYAWLILLIVIFAVACSAFLLDQFSKSQGESYQIELPLEKPRPLTELEEHIEQENTDESSENASPQEAESLLEAPPAPEAPTTLEESTPKEAIPSPPSPDSNSPENASFVPAQDSKTPVAAASSSALASLQEDLIEHTAEGPLPRLGTQGESPFKVYSRPFSKINQQPVVSIVLYGLGRNQNITEEAITHLPPEISLGFVPYARDLDQWLQRSREHGHEVLLTVPLEPLNFPNRDPGPYTLLTGLPEEQNLLRLKWTLSRGQGYIGLINFMGERFLTSPTSVTSLFKELKSRGLAFVESSPSQRSMGQKTAQQVGLPYEQSSVSLDEEISTTSLEQSLARTEQHALKTGAAIVVGFAHPLTITTLQKWLQTLQGKGILLAPVSAIIGRTTVPSKVMNKAKI